MMAEFIHTHPYLICNLLGLIPLGLLAAALPGQRGNILLAGLIWAPLAPMAVLHETYWAPIRLGGWRWGVEDVLYLFNVNAMAWGVTVGIAAMRYRVVLPGGIDLRRLGELAGVSILLGGGLLAAGITGMTAQVVANTFMGLWLLMRCPDLRALALVGVWLLPAIFLGELRLWFTLWPNFAEAWNPEPPCGLFFGGLPLGEIVFYLSFAIVSPTSVAFCRGTRVLPRPSPLPRRLPSGG